MPNHLYSHTLWQLYMRQQPLKPPKILGTSALYYKEKLFCSKQEYPQTKVANSSRQVTEFELDFVLASRVYKQTKQLARFAALFKECLPTTSEVVQILPLFGGL